MKFEGLTWLPYDVQKLYIGEILQSLEEFPKKQEFPQNLCHLRSPVVFQLYVKYRKSLRQFQEKWH